MDGNDGKFWEVSEHILNRIETPSYLAGRPAFSQYMEGHPWSARRKGINYQKTSVALILNHYFYNLFNGLGSFKFGICF